MNSTDRAALVRGLKRGIASAVVSLAVLTGLLYVVLRRWIPEAMYGPSQDRDGFGRLLFGRSTSVDTSMSGWELLWPLSVGRTVFIVVVATVVAVLIVAGIVVLRSRSPRIGTVTGAVVSFLIGAISIPLLAYVALPHLFRVGIGYPNVSGYADSNTLVLGVFVGSVLAGFGARALLRNGSLARLRRDPTVLLVDGWLAALWIGGAVVAIGSIYSVADAGYWLFRAIEESDAVLAFAVVLTLQIPLLGLVVLREVGWSMLRARRDVAPDGGVVEGSTTVGQSPGPRAGRSWLLDDVLSSRQVRVGLAGVASLGLLGGVAVLLARLELLPEDAFPAYNLELTAVLVGGFLGASLLGVTIATLGVLVAAGVRRLPRPDAVEVFTVDPLLNCLQAPFVFLVTMVVVLVSVDMMFWRSVTSTFVFVAIGGLAIAALVARVARLDVDDGRSAIRTTVRGVGIACTGVAVVSLSAIWPVVYSGAFAGSGFEIYWSRIWAFGLFATALIGSLFVLGEGLRRVSRVE